MTFSVTAKRDEGDQGDAGDAVGLEAVGGRPDRIAGVVAGAVGDDAGIARIVFLDVEDDLHQVGADVGDLGENAAGDAQSRSAERFADGEAEEAVADDLTRHEEQDDDHHHQFERDEEQADRHAGPQRNVDDIPRHAAQRGEGGAAVGVGVDADAVPGHRVGTAHADDREEQNVNERGDWADVSGLAVCSDVGFVPEAEQIVADGAGDQHPQHQQELALLNQVGFARLVDNLGDIQHRLVGGQPVDLRAQIQTHAEGADDDPGTDEQEVPGADAAEAGEMAVVQVGDGQVGFAGMGRGRSTNSSARCGEERFQARQPWPSR